MFQKIRGLGYLGVESPEYRVWEEIGPDVYAMQLGPAGSDGAIRLRIDDYDYRLSVHPGDEHRLRYLGWEVDSSRDLDEAVGVLEAAGVATIRATPDECEERRVLDYVRFSTPGGLPFELFCGARSKGRSFSSPRLHGGFVTGDMGMGHLVAFVPDGEVEEEFLRGVLGFQLTDTVLSPRGALNFLHVNRRHHSIACISTGGHSGLHHVMLQVNELDDVGIAHDRAAARGDLPLAMTLGRHSTDRMVSFYVHTPTGFEVEYGFGAIELTEGWIPTTTQFPAEVWGHEMLPDASFGRVDHS